MAKMKPVKAWAIVDKKGIVEVDCLLIIRKEHEAKLQVEKGEELKHVIIKEVLK